jgi:hypothetical protein
MHTGPAVAPAARGSAGVPNEGSSSRTKGAPADGPISYRHASGASSGRLMLLLNWISPVVMVCTPQACVIATGAPPAEKALSAPCLLTLLSALRVSLLDRTVFYESLGNCRLFRISFSDKSGSNQSMAAGLRRLRGRAKMASLTPHRTMRPHRATFLGRSTAVGSQNARGLTVLVVPLSAQERDVRD